MLNLNVFRIPKTEKKMILKRNDLIMLFMMYYFACIFAMESPKEDWYLQTSIYESCKYTCTKNDRVCVDSIFQQAVKDVEPKTLKNVAETRGNTVDKILTQGGYETHPYYDRETKVIIGPLDEDKQKRNVATGCDQKSGGYRFCYCVTKEVAEEYELTEKPMCEKICPKDTKSKGSFEYYYAPKFDKCEHYDFYYTGSKFKVGLYEEPTLETGCDCQRRMYNQVDKYNKDKQKLHCLKNQDIYNKNIWIAMNKNWTEFHLPTDTYLCQLQKYKPAEKIHKDFTPKDMDNDTLGDLDDMDDELYKSYNNYNITKRYQNNKSINISNTTEEYKKFNEKSINISNTDEGYKKYNNL